MKTRTIFILSVLLSALFFAAPVASAKKRSEGGDTEGHRRKGVELIDAKQYDQAIAEFTKEVEAAPGEPGAYRDRGTAYRVAARAAVAAGDGPPPAAKISGAGGDFLKENERAPKEPLGDKERGQNELGEIQIYAAIAHLNKGP